MSESGDLFNQSEDDFAPLADRMRPKNLDEFFGQSHLLGERSALRQALAQDRLHSMVFWGPPGTGKTTLARMIAHHCDAAFFSVSAVLGGVKEVREAIAAAKRVREQSGRRSVLFIDEVHRFNKAQQDAFLPHIEDGTVTFAGATTENPSFELNNALLSRVRVYVLKRLPADEVVAILHRAVSDPRGLGRERIQLADDACRALAQAADGDARRALNLLEIASDLGRQADGSIEIDLAVVKEVSGEEIRHFDKGGDLFYEQISALHKSVRGSNPDAALYWFCRMLDGGCDPRYIARRVLRIASEDIGLADPRATQLALQGWQSYERLGSPEGELFIAQAVIYLACAAKSNAAYTAYKTAMQAVKAHGNLDVPLHLRNAPTALMKDMGYKRDYRYAHDEAEGYAAGEVYFPDEMTPEQYYHPVERGLEIKLKEKLAYLQSLDRQYRR